MISPLLHHCLSLRAFFRRCLQAADKTTEIGRYNRLERNLFAAERMSKGNGRGMQCEAFVRSRLVAVLVVTHHRMSNARKMHPCLMLSPCQQINFQEGKVLGLLEDLVSRMS